MASSSISSSSTNSHPRTWRYRVFTSFHGPDVRKAFLSHLRKQFTSNGISMFDDQGIERSQTIAPALRQAVRESKISIVVLSKNYASSSWCLDELVEILRCKEAAMGQIVMTIFYGVDPSHVRKQTGDFGEVFKETCCCKTKEVRDRWSKALNDVGNIAGEHSLNWENESKMIEKIARDVSNKLNATISKDFEDMVGLETHMGKMQSLLHLDDENGVMIVGITGPAGIGKTTIARALHCRLSSRFQLNCFMENIRGSYPNGLDEYGLKLYLQQQLLSKILNQNGIRIYHLGAIPERLCDQNVLLILDDVDDLQQLEALANETNWFGPGSRIIITTKDQDILEQHGINRTYHVDFPSDEKARKIFCTYAFRQRFPPCGFEKLAERVTKLCNNLPLGLSVMGSSLRGKREDDWECILHRLENSLDQKIEGVLRVGYDNLHKDDQLLFLLIAFFFNYEDDDHVMAMLEDSNLDVRLGLKTLAYKSLILKSTRGKIVMHKLLQQVGREVVQRQDSGKRQILIDTDEIRDVLENDYGSISRSLMGISLDISTIVDNMDIRAGAFKSMRNLRFLSIYKARFDSKVRVHVSEDMEFPPRLRLLRWEVYPRKCLPQTFCPEYLVELDLRRNLLEKLWEGTQLLINLKKMILGESLKLKELPDLSNAINLERLDLFGCESLVEIPSYIGNLQKLEYLELSLCTKLQVVPTLYNLASLETIRMLGCYQLRKLPDISGNITTLIISDTILQELPNSVRHFCRLATLCIYGIAIGSPPPNLALPKSSKLVQERSGADIKRIPPCIRYLYGLKELYIGGCKKLASLPELSGSLTTLTVDKCESLETLIPFSLDSQIENLYFINCFKLCREAMRVITRQCLWGCLPGRTIPEEFNYRALGNLLSITDEFNHGFKICVVVSPKEEMVEDSGRKLLCRIGINGCRVEEIIQTVYIIELEHLFLLHYELPKEDRLLEQKRDILFEFSTTSQDIEIIECGVQILDRTRSSQRSYE